MNKIKIRPSTAGDRWTVTLPSGTTREIVKDSEPHWSSQPFRVRGIDGHSTFGSLDLAIEAAAASERRELAPLPYTADELRAMAEAAEGSIDAATKTIARLLRERTGRTWSVTRGRGTAYSWLMIKAPPRRMVSYRLSFDDQAVLSSALGWGVHCQGESVRPCSGVHGSYIYHAAGHPVPEDWRVASPSWD